MDDFEVRDRDGESKEKITNYGNMKGGVTPSNVIQEDKVLAEQKPRKQVEYFVQVRTHDCESEAWKQCYSRFK